ncbi:MAG: RluA family pseudouridine synthase [Muribaculaceae bacterium]|nr:RluA family pseudouridine synthase [Muribaculaceae bacterium]MBQ7212444.1 RluA family pseudouridine synthase [Muribaculaceae bacterium]
MEVVYEDNHIIIVNKAPGEIVQGDKTGTVPLLDIVKEWIKVKYAKPGNVFLGLVHRIDRPVGGLVVFAKTSKALSRMNNLFRQGKVRKTYLAIVHNRPPSDEERIECHLRSIEKINKTFVVEPDKEGAQYAALSYKLVASSDNYFLLQINLETGRKHQIRAMLSNIGCPIHGDIKYGDRRTNTDGSIDLLAYRIQFEHPVSHNIIDITAPCPDKRLWHALFDNFNKTS